MNLKFFKPIDNGGSVVTSYELYVNDGDSSNEPETKIMTYTDGQMEHVLKDDDDSLTAGLIYKLKFRAINAIGNSDDSEIVQYALVDKPSATTEPTCIKAQTSTN